MEENKSFKIFSFLQGVLVLYITIWTIAPPLQIDLVYRLAALGAAGLWMILNIPRKFNLERIHILALVFLLLVVAVALVESKGDLEYVLKPIALYLLVLAFIMAHCYKDRWEELEWIVPIVLLVLAIFNFKTFRVIDADPTITRHIVRNDVETYDYLRQGVGGYGLLYSQVCVFPFIVSWTYSAFKGNKFKFIIGIIWFISYLLFLLNSGYSIAVITSFVALVILLFYRRDSIVLAVVITFLLVLLTIWLIGYNDAFRNALMQLFDSTKVAMKINDVYLSITTRDAADSILSRTERYKESIRSAFTYPVIGGLWFSDGSGGGHSAIMDAFAKYGAFGGYVFIRMVFGKLIEIKKSPKTAGVIRVANATFIAMLLVLLFNSMPFNLVCTIMFIVPICYNEILKWRNSDENLMERKSFTQRSRKTHWHKV
jgi:hypothetical protein